MQSAAVLQMNYLNRNITVSTVCLCIYTTTASFMQLLPTIEHWYMGKCGVWDGDLGLTKGITMENMQKVWGFQRNSGKHYAIKMKRCIHSMGRDILRLLLLFGMSRSSSIWKTRHLSSVMTIWKIWKKMGGLLHHICHLQRVTTNDIC